VVQIACSAASLRGSGFSEEQQPPDAAAVPTTGRLAKTHPEVADSLRTAVASVNREFALPEQVLRGADEVALFPPVSGGAGGPPTHLRVTDEPLDFNALLASIILPTTGAACVFSGMVRGESEGEPPRVTERLEYEAYAPMAEDKLRQVAQEIRARWPSVEGIALVQRSAGSTPGRRRSSSPVRRPTATAASSRRRATASTASRRSSQCGRRKSARAGRPGSKGTTTPAPEDQG
jgi:molybdopterin synthase catalytic subunit